MIIFNFCKFKTQSLNPFYLVCITTPLYHNHPYFRNPSTYCNNAPPHPLILTMPRPSPHRNNAPPPPLILTIPAPIHQVCVPCWTIVTSTNSPTIKLRVSRLLHPRVPGLDCLTTSPPTTLATRVTRVDPSVLPRLELPPPPPLLQQLPVTANPLGGATLSPAAMQQAPQLMPWTLLRRPGTPQRVPLHAGTLG